MLPQLCKGFMELEPYAVCTHMGAMAYQTTWLEESAKDVCYMHFVLQAVPVYAWTFIEMTFIDDSVRSFPCL